MTRNRNQEETQTAESTGRRQFLRNAMRIGGAAALMLTAATRETLAGSFALNERQLEAARRARQAPSAPGAANNHTETAAYQGCDCSGCSGCTSSCTGCNGCSSCSGCTGCSGTSK
jgi:hypothetical protein